MDIKNTGIPGLIMLTPQRHFDDRGYLVEAFNDRRFRDAGIASSFVQDNQSFSVSRGTVRGLHFQLPPFSQAKMIRVLRGSIFDVAVDLRVGAPTYGMWIAERLTAEAGEQMFVPRGFAHGFCTLEPNTEVIYKVDEYYSHEHDSGLIWNDATLAINWPVASKDAVLSDKDHKLGPFSDFLSPFKYDGA
jgi:dTDP-4-dehydrorhamnose 3,5-epimerase